jgi:hypothetical protein
MNIAMIGPGIMPIPPDGWGAVESLIWDYALELDNLGHTGTIINTPDYNEILNYLKEDKYDFAHLHYDVFYELLDFRQMNCLLACFLPVLRHRPPFH